jgi:hypothetical protein
VASPTYAVLDAEGTVITDGGRVAGLAQAKALADVWALHRPGIQVEVHDDAGELVYATAATAKAKSKASSQ